jgi:hypothetical protein
MATVTATVESSTSKHMPLPALTHGGGIPLNLETPMYPITYAGALSMLANAEKAARLKPPADITCLHAKSGLCPKCQAGALSMLANAEKAARAKTPAGITCLHAQNGLCPKCQADYDEDPQAYVEFGQHPQGEANWQAERDKLLADNGIDPTLCPTPLPGWGH